MDFRRAPPESPDALRLLDEYLTDLERRIDGWARERYVDAEAEKLVPPAGVLLLGYLGVEAVACGVVHIIEPGVAEVKRMFVAPAARGRGAGRALLGALEEAALGLGCEVARLDSAAPLAEAIALYRSAGYAEIDDYNRNPNANTWMERRLR